MLAAEFRIPAKLIPIVARKGKRIHKTWFTLVVLPALSDPHPHFAFVVSTKVNKSAVVRNRIKRRLRAAIYQLLKEGQIADTSHYMFLVKDSSPADVEYADLVAEVQSAITKR
jgi:ribonuclease P protein component